MDFGQSQSLKECAGHRPTETLVHSNTKRKVPKSLSRMDVSRIFSRLPTIFFFGGGGASMGDISLGPNHWMCFIFGACIELAI